MREALLANRSRALEGTGFGEPATLSHGWEHRASVQSRGPISAQKPVFRHLLVSKSKGYCVQKPPESCQPLAQASTCSTGTCVHAYGKHARHQPVHSPHK